MKHSESITELATALNLAQDQMGSAKKNAKNPFFKSSYSNLEEVISCVKQPFADHGLSFVQFPVSDEDRAGVETIIAHKSGQWISGSFMLKCSKLDPQGMASAISYARRYGLQAAVGLPSSDDDGNAASAPTTAPKKPAMTSKQASETLAMAKNIKELTEAFKALPVDMQQNAEVKAVATARKAEMNPLNNDHEPT